MPMREVVVVGGGPAGAMAALLLARAGIRVRVFERARFPRHKLCGDTLNPGALRVLERHVDLEWLRATADPLEGMLLTGPGGARIEGRYGHGAVGRAVTRAAFDDWLVRRAEAAGAAVEEGVAVQDVTVIDGVVNGVVVRSPARAGLVHRASLVIAADGRRSTLAFARRLARQPRRPRRWAIGAYFEGVAGLGPLGEMHVRRDHYVGVAPLPGGIANACLVVPRGPGDPPIADPDRLLIGRLRADRELGPRFRSARVVSRAVMLGPMAVDCLSAGEPGLLLAGDASGFIDPMTGDGLRLALEGAELAARVAVDVLSDRLRVEDAPHVLAARRRAAFARKWRFNRSLRALVARPRGVGAGALVARVAPGMFERMIQYAGDVGHA
jgi:flavin-dependent dehydrogenase